MPKKIFITTVLLFFLFFFGAQPSYAVFGVGANCNANGHPGICKDRSTTGCSTYYDSGNFCPGGASVQCCVSAQVVCHAPPNYPNEQCHNSANGNVYPCGGHFDPGNYCPGPQDVKCCVPPPPPPAACPVGTTPSGSVISTGVQTTASKNSSGPLGSQWTVDGVIDNNYWNSGGFPPAWIELNLGAKQPVTGLTLIAVQSPSGSPTHQILAGPTANPTTIVKTISGCTVTDGQTMNIVFNPPLTNVQYIRINTTASNSWVAWREISVYGSAPGTQTTTPGIIFSGDGSATFGQGDSSINKWVVGGPTYPEVYQTASNQSPTSYQYLLDKAISSKATVTNLTTVSGCNDLSNCTLPANLANGIYQANGNLNLQGYTFPTGKNYVFLVDGDLNILGNIVTPNGSTAIFSASNDIIIDKNVGTATNLFPLPAGQLQGIFSADRDFRINGINDCVTGKDKMLNVEGAIVTNASGNGGNFRTQRDLCGDNANYPALTIRLRLDFLLNAPTFIQKQSTTIHEDAP